MQRRIDELEAKASTLSGHGPPPPRPRTIRIEGDGTAVPKWSEVWEKRPET